MSRPIAALCLFALLLSAEACRTNPWRQRLVFSRSPVAIYFERKEEKGKVVPQGFSHPALVSARDLDDFLRKLRYRDWGIFKGSRIEPVFTEGEASALAEPLSQFLSKAEADERVRFLVARTAWSFIHFGAKGVSGVAFFDSPDRMNLAFDLIDESLSDEAGDPKAMVFRDDPVLITGTKPEIVAPQGASIREGLEAGKIHPRWIAVDRKALAPIKESPPAASTPAGLAEDAASQKSPTSEDVKAEAESVQRRLKVLEELKRSGALSDEEYEKARREILLQRTP